MKTVAPIFLFIALYPLLTFSQDVNSSSPEKLMLERMQEIHNAQLMDPEVSGDTEAQHIKSIQVVRDKLLRNIYRTGTMEHVSEVNIIETTIYNTLLDNDFLLIERFYQSWDGTKWVNSWKRSYTYDDNNNRTESLIQRWDGNDWMNSNKRSYTYDNNNNRIEWLSYTWNGDNWVNHTRESSFYIRKTSIKHGINTFSLLQNYPNPFNTISTIEYRIASSAFVKLSIYNPLGQKVATLVNKNQAAGTYIVQWDASSFASGMYFYKLHTDKGFIQSKKLVLLK